METGNPNKTIQKHNFVIEHLLGHRGKHRVRNGTDQCGKSADRRRIRDSQQNAFAELLQRFAF